MYDHQMGGKKSKPVKGTPLTKIDLGNASSTDAPTSVPANAPTASDTKLARMELYFRQMGSPDKATVYCDGPFRDLAMTNRLAKCLATPGFRGYVLGSLSVLRMEDDHHCETTMRSISVDGDTHKYCYIDETGVVSIITLTRQKPGTVDETIVL